MVDLSGLFKDDEFTELVDADIPRVDLVDKAANGMRFLLAKRADGPAGLLEPDYVRDLIAKAEPEATDTGRDGGNVTVTGSPGAIAKFIHQAAQRAAAPVAKAKYDADDLRRMAANGEAMDDESYPIADRDDLDRAIRAVGRGGTDHDAIRRHVIARAKALGASSEIPDNWNADGSLKEGVAKEMDMADDLDPTAPFAEPDETYDGVPTNPGSPAWEAIDAATARKWTSILARARNAVDLLADREMLEAASGDDDDAMQACDLQDACCAIDYAISILAPFAVAEQAEADCGDEMAAVGKALHGWDPGALDTIEALGQVRKAGRVLSSANEAAIRGAVESLQKVLASLPQAPTAPDDGQSVAKEQETDMTAKTAVAAPADESAPVVAKADGEKTPMTVVYDQKGRLIGIVDPTDITPVANSEAEPDDAPPADAPVVDAGDGDAAPADGSADMTPAPAGDVGTPADAVDDGVAKTTASPDDSSTDGSDVLKSIATEVDRRLADYSVTHEEAITKTAADVAAVAKALEAVAEVSKTLDGRLKALEEQEAVSKVFTNGAVPPAHQLRGQDRGERAAQVDVAKAAEMKATLYKGTAAEQNKAAIDMQTLAIAQLREIHQRRA